MQSFVHGYRECNIPVQVKGGSLAQSVAFRHLVLGITCAKMKQDSSKAASISLTTLKKKWRKSL